MLTNLEISDIEIELGRKIDASLDAYTRFLQQLLQIPAALLETALIRSIGGWGDMVLLGYPNLISYGPGAAERTTAMTSSSSWRIRADVQNRRSSGEPL